MHARSRHLPGVGPSFGMPPLLMLPQVISTSGLDALVRSRRYDHPWPRREAFENWMPFTDHDHVRVSRYGKTDEGRPLTLFSLLPRPEWHYPAFEFNRLNTFPDAHLALVAADQMHANESSLGPAMHAVFVWFLRNLRYLNGLDAAIHFSPDANPDATWRARPGETLCKTGKEVALDIALNTQRDFAGDLEPELDATIWKGVPDDLNDPASIHQLSKTQQGHGLSRLIAWAHTANWLSGHAGTALAPSYGLGSFRGDFGMRDSFSAILLTYAEEMERRGVALNNVGPAAFRLLAPHASDHPDETPQAPGTFPYPRHTPPRRRMQNVRREAEDLQRTPQPAWLGNMMELLAGAEERLLFLPELPVLMFERFPDGDSSIDQTFSTELESQCNVIRPAMDIIHELLGMPVTDKLTRRSVENIRDLFERTLSLDKHYDLLPDDEREAIVRGFINVRGSISRAASPLEMHYLGPRQRYLTAIKLGAVARYAEACGRHDIATGLRAVVEQQIEDLHREYGFIVMPHRAITRHYAMVTLLALSGSPVDRSPFAFPDDIQRAFGRVTSMTGGHGYDDSPHHRPRRFAAVAEWQ